VFPGILGLPVQVDRIAYSLERHWFRPTAKNGRCGEPNLESPFGLALERLRDFRIAVTALDGAFGQVGLAAQSCQAECPGGGVNAGR